jgi:hypothetical protein
MVDPSDKLLTQDETFNQIGELEKYRHILGEDNIKFSQSIQGLLGIHCKKGL